MLLVISGRCKDRTHRLPKGCRTVWYMSTPKVQVWYSYTHTHTHTRLTALCPGLPGWAGTRKAKPIWILLKQETVRGSGISWAICKSAPCSRQITMPTPHHSVFTGRMPFLPPNQQRQSTEGIEFDTVSRVQCRERHTDRQTVQCTWSVI